MYYSITDNFIGYSPLHRTSMFYHGRDSKENYETNLKKLGPSWYYANKNISYLRNSLGHREKEPSELQLDNYILCVGCSVTEGIALEVQTRYSNLLKNDLNIDVYNMGVGGTGNDVIAYNLLTWLSSVKSKPKFVVVQWSDTYRFITETEQHSLNVNGAWNISKEFFQAADEVNYFNTKSMLLRKLIKQTDIPVIEIPWNHQVFAEPTKDDIILPVVNFLDFGRDLLHPGIKMHRKWADLIIERAQNLL